MSGVVCSRKWLVGTKIRGQRFWSTWTDVQKSKQLEAKEIMTLVLKVYGEKRVSYAVVQTSGNWVGVLVVLTERVTKKYKHLDGVMKARGRHSCVRALTKLTTTLLLKREYDTEVVGVDVEGYLDAVIRRKGTKAYLGIKRE